MTVAPLAPTATRVFPSRIQPLTGEGLSFLAKQVNYARLQHSDGVAKFFYLHIDHEVAQDLPERRRRR
jgi:hypothetical protein